MAKIIDFGPFLEPKTRLGLDFAQKSSKKSIFWKIQFPRKSTFWAKIQT